MVRCPRRVVRAVLAPLALVALLAACGGSSTTKTFTLDVHEGDQVKDLYTRAMIAAVQYCIDNGKLIRVSWTFDKSDIDKPVVQQYTNPAQPQGPMSIPCDQVRQQNIDPSQLTTPPPEPSTSTSEEGPSSQQQDEGGRGTGGSTTTTAAGGDGGGSVSSAPGSTTTVKP